MRVDKHAGCLCVGMLESRKAHRGFTLLTVKLPSVAHAARCHLIVAWRGCNCNCNAHGLWLLWGSFSWLLWNM